MPRKQQIALIIVRSLLWWQFCRCSFHFYVLQIPWDKQRLTADCAMTRTVPTTIWETARNKTGHLREGHPAARNMPTLIVTGIFCPKLCHTFSTNSIPKHRGTLPSYASQMAGMSSRIGSGIGSTSGPPVGTASGLNSTNHVVPNLQSMRRSSPNSSSQYSQWRIQKDLGVAGRCSWKFVAIFFVLLSVILVSALIYTTGKLTFPLLCQK